MFDMNQCKPEDKLICRDGTVVEYVGERLSDIYPHSIVYPNGGRATRTDDGRVIKSELNNRDIVDFYKEENMQEKLERNKVYTLEVTGEELLIILFLLGRSCGHGPTNLYGRVREKVQNQGVDFSKFPLPGGTTSAWDANLRGAVSAWKDAIFNQETEDQRKLRELKEQYQALGVKIKQMEE